MPAMSSSLLFPGSSLPGRLVGGPKTVLLCLVAVPPAVLALASDGWVRVLAGLISAVGLALVPASLYSRKIAALVPVAAGALLALAAVTLSFDSVAFVVSMWATFTMLLISLPKRVMRIA
jgi:hypothetical protein